MSRVQSINSIFLIVLHSALAYSIQVNSFIIRRMYYGMLQADKLYLISWWHSAIVMHEGDCYALYGELPHHELYCSLWL